MGRACEGRLLSDKTEVVAVDLDAPSVDGATGVVSFPVSDQASFISGVDVLIDGGGLEGLRSLSKS